MDIKVDKGDWREARVTKKPPKQKLITITKPPRQRMPDGLSSRVIG